MTSNDPEKREKAIKFLKGNEKYASNKLPKKTARMTFGPDMA